MSRKERWLETNTAGWEEAGRFSKPWMSTG
jgi:hypothetical protein